MMQSKTKILSVFIIAFLIIAVGIASHSNIISIFDEKIAHFAYSVRSPILDKVMIFATNAGSVYGSIIIFAIFGAFLLARKKKYSLYILALASLSGIIASILIKHVVGRVRPAGYLITETGFSFPSNHAVGAVIFFFSAIFLVAHVIQNRFFRSAFLIIISVLFPLIALSRIYLSVHFATDVIGGVLLGSIFYLFSDIIVSKHSLQNLEKYDINKR